MKAHQSSQVPFEPGTVVGGKYRIVSLIGIGGVGRVYLARHIELDTEVAVKVLRPEMSDRPEAIQRFSREARASVRLRSERIARVLDVGTHEGKPYFVMEYMVGCNLLEVRQQASVDIATLCEFFIQACEGLADAHAQGVVHRDIKPENLFVVRDASGWRSLKVFDFGISKVSLTGKYSDVDLGAMRTEAMMGTPHYISPEQIRSTREVDHRTDIWSLGAVMFEVLSGGVLPFREEREVTALIAEVLERPHRSLLDVAPNVPERLAAIVDRCLAKDRDLRYQTTAEVALDLLPLAPARARASAERAVSVMQAAGLMALNGDMESLRPSSSSLSDRSLSSPPPSEEPGQVPSSGRRTSESQRAAATPSSDSVPPASAGLAPVSAGMAPVSTGVAPVSISGASRPPMPAPRPAMPSARADSQRAAPASVPPSALLPAAMPAVDVDVELDVDGAVPGKARKRRAALVLFLVALLSLVLIALLLTRGATPERVPSAQKVVTPAAPKSQITEPVAVETAAPVVSAPPDAPSASHKPPVPKAVWWPRAVVAAAPKAPVTKSSESASSSPSPSPPIPKLDLRRER